MKVEIDGVEVEITFDADGFPRIDITLAGFESETGRPTVDVVLNGVVIHDLFDNTDADARWADPPADAA